MRVDVLNGFLHRLDSLDGNGRAEELSTVVGGGGGCDKLAGFGDIGVSQSGEGRSVAPKADRVGHEGRCDSRPNSGEERGMD